MSRSETPVAPGEGEGALTEVRAEALDASAGAGLLSGLDQGDAPLVAFVAGAMNADPSGAHIDRDVSGERGIVRHPPLDVIALVAKSHDEIIESVMGVHLDDVPEDGLSTHLNHRLRLFDGLLREPAAEPTGQNRDLHPESSVRA